MTGTRVVSRSSNTRDLGGLRAGAHGRVRASAWYRGSAAGVSGLHAQRHLRTVFDLRSAMEIAREPLDVPGAEIRVRSIEVSRAVLRSTNRPQPSHYLTYYRNMVGAALAISAELVGALGQREHTPVIVCCTAGKDRTSVVCALALRAVGVRIADIAADHQLTSRMLRPADVPADLGWASGSRPEVIACRLVATAQTMRALLTGLDRAHEGIAEKLIAAGLSRPALDRARARIITRDPP